MANSRERGAARVPGHEARWLDVEMNKNPTEIYFHQFTGFCVADYLSTDQQHKFLRRPKQSIWSFEHPTAFRGDMC